MKKNGTSTRKAPKTPPFAIRAERAPTRGPQRESGEPRVQTARDRLAGRQGDGETGVNIEDFRRFAAKQFIAGEEALKLEENE